MKNSVTLNLTAKDFQELAYIAIERISSFIDEIPTRTICQPLPSLAYLATLNEPLPSKPNNYEELLDSVFNNFLSYGRETGAPGNISYITGGGLLHASIANLITTAVNRYMPVWEASPALVEIEKIVIRWFADMLGFPRNSMGILTSGSSLATFSAVLAARKKYLGESLSNATCYTSDIAHYCIGKATMMAGIPAHGLREIPTDDNFRISVNVLRESIHRDRKAGLKPFLIIATAGATRTGSVDDLQALAEVAHKENLWLHVDAAYGGFFMLTDRGKFLLRGIEHADSVALDPHKSLFMPYGTGILIMRDRQELYDAFQNDGARYWEQHENQEMLDFCEYSPELSREWRGLRIWLPLKMIGSEAFREELDEKLDLTHWVTEQLRMIPEIEIMSEPELSVVTFRYHPPGLSEEELNKLNHALLTAINAKNRVYMMNVLIRKIFVLRICVLSYRTHKLQLEYLLQDLGAAIADL